MTEFDQHPEREIRRLERILDTEGDTPRARRAAARLEQIQEAELLAIEAMLDE